jgi:DNA polymerase elongation subunit (family B)
MLFHLLDTLAHDCLVELKKIPEHEKKYHRHGAKEVQDNSADRSTYILELFGVTEKGEPTHLTVTGFRPYFYVQLNSSADEASVKSYVLEKLRPKCTQCFSIRDFDECVEFELVHRKLLFGYTANRRFPMLKISVSSAQLFNKAKKLFIDQKLTPIYLGSNGHPLQVYEANLDPMLRFFHLQKLDPCGWIEIDCDFEYDDIAGRLKAQCEWDEVKPPAVKPGKSGAYLLASWDIECYSADGSFPLPERDSDAIIQIGVVLLREGVTSRHCFVLNDCAPVAGVDIQSFKTERDLLVAWAGFMCEKDPDVWIGYNIFGFDERYVWKRAEKCGLVAASYDEWRDKTSYIAIHPSFQGFARLDDYEVKLNEKMLSSSALGDNRLYIWDSPGRLQIDLYHYIKRLEALTSYKLDDVTSHYMSGKLKGIRQEKGRVYLKTAVTKDVRVGRSIKILDETGEPVAEKCTVESIGIGEIVLFTDEPLEDVDLQLARKWAIVKDDVPPAEIFRLHREGGPTGRAKVADYCVQDCNLVVELFYKLDVFNNAMSMANVCSVPVNYIFTRGQGIKIESLIFKECHWRDQVVKVLPAPAGAFGSADDSSDEPEQDSYEGAIVFPPKPDFYFDAPVGVCDFASLYPSSIISENISYDTLVWSKDYDLSGNLVHTEPDVEPTEFEPGVKFTDIEFDILRADPMDTHKHPEKKVAGLRVCRYAQLGETKGTLPAILQMLLASRKAKRKQAEKESDPFVKALLDAEQLAYKLTANSLYGQLGSPTFKIRLQNLAASTTAYGRKQITFAKEAIYQFYGTPAGRADCCAELVYGDTDSLFVNFNPRGPDGERLKGREALVRTIELTEECGKFITAGLKPPHDFEYDKTFWPFIIFSKKRYVGNKYEENPDEFKQNYMGIVLKRRDNAPIVKTIYGGAINILLNQRDVAAAATFVREKCKELVAGKVSLGQLTITKSLRDNYADPTRIAHKVLADRIAQRDPGNAPSSGDRIPYVYITNPKAELQGDRIEMPSYVREKGLRPDIPFYVEHQLSNPLAQLFALRVEEIPGFDGRPSGWAADEGKRAAQREKVAAQLLFQESLQVFNGQATLKTMGFKKAERVVQVSSLPEPSAQPQAQAQPIVRKQMVLSSYWASRIEEESYKKPKKVADGTKSKQPKGKGGLNP